MARRGYRWRKGKAEDTFWLIPQRGVLCRRCGKLLKKGDTVYYRPGHLYSNPYAPRDYVLCPSCFKKIYKSLKKANK
jgi:hypothetical protein